MSINYTVFFVAICTCIYLSHSECPPSRAGYKFVEYSGKTAVKPEMIRVSDENDLAVVVGAFYIRSINQFLPAKVKPTSGVAYSSYYHRELNSTNFFILETDEPGDYSWSNTSNGIYHTIPDNPVRCGETPATKPYDGHQPIFVGAHKYQNNITRIGKIQNTDRKIFVPFDGKEEVYNDYLFLEIPRK